MPIIIAASLKTAQGSGTVAIITGASLMAPLLGTLGMDSSSGRALVVVALGAGGMIASHANDSYFWVVTQMSDLSVNQGYKLQTLGTLDSWNIFFSGGLVIKPDNFINICNYQSEYQLYEGRKNEYKSFIEYDQLSSY